MCWRFLRAASHHNIFWRRIKLPDLRWRIGSMHFPPNCTNYNASKIRFPATPRQEPEVELALV